MPADQVLGCGHDVSRQRQPVEMRDHQTTTGLQKPPYFLGRGIPVKPVPALAGHDQIERGIGQAGVLSHCQDVFNIDTRGAV